jgi:hypothetical protein
MVALTSALTFGSIRLILISAAIASGTSARPVSRDDLGEFVQAMEQAHE